jgi:hypothetical protein
MRPSGRVIATYSPRPYRVVQGYHIRETLRLNETDRLDVIELLARAMKNNQTRVVLLAIVRFTGNGETLVVPDMPAFFRTFESHTTGDTRVMEFDTFSSTLMDSASEDAFQQCVRLIDFLEVTHHGWYLTVRDGKAVCKKPKNVFHRIANAFDDRVKEFKEFRLVVDLAKTMAITRTLMVAHEREVLFRPPTVAVQKRAVADASETTASASSSIFNTTVSQTSKSATKANVPPKIEMENAKSSTSSTSSDDDDVVLSSSAKELSTELTAERQWKKAQTSNHSSRTTSSTSVTKSIPRIPLNPPHQRARSGTTSQGVNSKR